MFQLLASVTPVSPILSVKIAIQMKVSSAGKKMLLMLGNPSSISSASCSLSMNTRFQCPCALISIGCRCRSLYRILFRDVLDTFKIKNRFCVDKLGCSRRKSRHFPYFPAQPVSWIGRILVELMFRLSSRYSSPNSDSFGQLYLDLHFVYSNENEISIQVR